MPLAKMKTVLGAITSQHKCVVRTIMVLNAPFAISILYQALSYFIDENTKRKINILSSSTCSILVELTAPNQLEQKFGGTAPNKVVGQFWPPCLPDNDFGVDGVTDVTGVKDVVLVAAGE